MSTEASWGLHALQRWVGDFADYVFDSRMGKRGWQYKGTSGPRNWEKERDWRGEIRFAANDFKREACPDEKKIEKSWDYILGEDIEEGDWIWIKIPLETKFQRQQRQEGL